MPRRLPRPPPSALTRAKMAAAKRGRPRSAETKARIAATLVGKKHPPERVAKAKANRRPPPKGDEAIIAACFNRNMEKQAREVQERREQWHRDVVVAELSGRRDLAEDVKRSEGWTWSRKVFDGTGTVSYGYAGGMVHWSLRTAAPYIVAPKAE
jgi:hypothetical protein